MKPTSPGFVSTLTLERRTVLRWLGNTTVLSLGGALAACAGGSLANRDSPDSAPAGGLPRDGGPERASNPDFPFAPGERVGDIYNGWKGNTVDPQNLADILASWTLKVDGLVAAPTSLGFAELVALARQDQVTDFHCVEGWSVHDVPWNGVRLAHLLDRVGILAGGTHLTFHSVGGLYKESLPLAIAREPRTLLAYGVGGSTLPLPHGFPVRLVVPRLLGYKNAKYLARIEVTDHPETGYWEQFGYSYEAEVPTSRLRPDKY